MSYYLFVLDSLSYYSSSNSNVLDPHTKHFLQKTFSMLKKTNPQTLYRFPHGHNPNNQYIFLITECACAWHKMYPQKNECDSRNPKSKPKHNYQHYHHHHQRRMPSAKHDAQRTSVYILEKWLIYITYLGIYSYKYISRVSFRVRAQCPFFVRSRCSR